MKENFWKLTLLTNKGLRPLDDYLEFILLCAEAGVTSVQLREKNLPSRDLLHFGKFLKKLLDARGIPLIINDHLDLCLELDAAGVHLGQADGNPLQARTVLGPDKIIGLSINNKSQIISAQTLPIDYIGLGAIFPTQNKKDVETIWGLSGLKTASLMSVHPIVAIGGIDESNIGSVIRTGASGIAIIGAFHNADNPYETTQHLTKIINEEYDNRKNKSSNC